MVFFKHDYPSIKQNKLQGRYITHHHISSILDGLSDRFIVEDIGESVNGHTIKSVTAGQGPTKIFMWSQMHGNESTTTKAVFDLFGLLESGIGFSTTVLENCTLKIIPILNPDGAMAYTRVNANSIDLNRDAQDRSQPESKVLRACFDSFEPDFCFNLHDQRTIFNVGKTSKPATLSFLAPAFDVERNTSESRTMSMQLIAAMNQELQKAIPGQIGRYDDSFNANCIGDTFQMLNVPTVLFEAGHYPGDYARETTRMFVFRAMVTAIRAIVEKDTGRFTIDDYFNIPENNSCFYDVLIRNAHVIDKKKYSENDTIAILFKEVLEDKKIAFRPIMAKIGSLQGFYGHKNYDCAMDEDLEQLNKQSFRELI